MINHDTEFLCIQTSRCITIKYAMVNYSLKFIIIYLKLSNECTSTSTLVRKKNISY